MNPDMGWREFLRQLVPTAVLVVGLCLGSRLTRIGWDAAGQILTAFTGAYWGYVRRDEWRHMGMMIKKGVVARWNRRRQS